MLPGVRAVIDFVAKALDLESRPWLALSVKPAELSIRRQPHHVQDDARHQGAGTGEGSLSRFTPMITIQMPTASGCRRRRALEERRARVLKTLMALVDGKPVCVIVPSDHEVSLKKLAAAFGGKGGPDDEKPADAEHAFRARRLAGSALSARCEKVPIVPGEFKLLNSPLVYINGGQRGLQGAPEKRLKGARQLVLGAIAAPLITLALRAAIWKT